MLLDIFADDGRQLGHSRATLASGSGTFLVAAVGNPDERTLLRAIGQHVVATRADAKLCGALVFTVEVYDSTTGIDSFMATQPD